MQRCKNVCLTDPSNWVQVKNSSRKEEHWKLESNKACVIPACETAEIGNNNLPILLKYFVYFPQETYGMLVCQLEELNMTRKCTRRPKLCPNKLYSNEHLGLQSKDCSVTQDTTLRLRQLESQQQDSVSFEDPVSQFSLLGSGHFPSRNYNRINTDGFLLNKKVPFQNGHVIERYKSRFTHKFILKGETNEIFISNAWSNKRNCIRKDTNTSKDFSTDESNGTNIDFTSEDSDLSDYEKGDYYVSNLSKPLEFGLTPKAFNTYESEIGEFSYPEFLPSPMRNLDLQNISLLEGDQKGLVQTQQDCPIGSILIRLLQMEKMQQITIQKEKSKMPCSYPGTAASTSLTKQTLKHSKSQQVKSPCIQTECNANGIGIYCANLKHQHSSSQPQFFLNDYGHSRSSLMNRNNSIKRPRTTCESRKSWNKRPPLKQSALNRPQSSSANFCRLQSLCALKPVRPPSRPVSLPPCSSSNRKFTASKKISGSTIVVRRKSFLSQKHNTCGSDATKH
ncbi:protein FAM217A-like [Huso huso]|uniref:Protein FAM217A-like n=1 Tax=Huso huso TaxID=61971 RepID=A0ABR1A0L7_HUSHU